MRARTLSILFVVFGLLVSTSCKKAADLAKYKDQAMALASQYAPQLKDLSGKLDGLMAKAKSLPVTIPGVDKVTKLLEDNKGNLGKLQGLVDSIPSKAADAVKTGKKAEVEGLISTINSEVGGGITKITTDLATATTEVAALEKKAAEAAAATATGDFTKALPGGAEIKGAASGVEAQLIAFIEDASRAVDKTTWFDFDRLTFGTGGAALDMDKSKDQLANIVAILKAYPNVRLKVGGYTDNTGKPEDNKKLSGDRAAAVVAALKDAGVEPKRLEAEGYGSEHPVCTDDTDECRAKNRRIAVRVSAK